MVSTPRGESRDEGLRVDRPDGPPFAPALDAGTWKARSDQAARADVRARSYDVETILGPTHGFAHLEFVLADAQQRREEGVGFVDEAQLSGDRLVRAIDDGTHPDLADSPFAGRSSEQLEEQLASARDELEFEDAALLVHERILAGEATDETGAVWKADVPKTTARAYGRRKFRDQAIFAPFEIVFAFFVYRLTVGSSEGANQVLMETMETIGVVAIALLVQLLVPPLVAHGIALLHRYDPTSDSRAGTFGRWVRLAVPTSGVVLLIILAALLRGAYLASLQGDDSALAIGELWFVLFAVVLLTMPMVVVVLVTLAKNYANPHIEEVLTRRPVVAGLTQTVADLRAELGRRDRLVEAQETITAVVVENWMDEVLHGIPAKAVDASATYLETFVRESEDPAVSDAVSVSRAASRATSAAVREDQHARVTERFDERRKEAHRAARARAAQRSDRADARTRDASRARPTGSVPVASSDPSPPTPTASDDAQVRS